MVHKYQYPIQVSPPPTLNLTLFSINVSIILIKKSQKFRNHEIQKIYGIIKSLKKKIFGEKNIWRIKHLRKKINTNVHSYMDKYYSDDKILLHII